MSNFADIWDKIRDRAAADTAAGSGLFMATTPLINGFYYAAIPENVPMPFCVFNIAADRDQSVFTANISEVMFRIMVAVPRISATISDPTLRGSQILKRLYGDSATGSLTPSYGFHRFSPTLTDWTATGITYQNTFEEHGDNEYVWVTQWKLWVSK